MSAAARARETQTEPDRLEGFAAPREVAHTIGHADAIQEFNEALRSGRMHHAWLLSGPEGIGKATLAYQVARALLRGDASVGEQGDDPADMTFRKVAGQAHPNLLVIRRPFNDKTKKYSQWIAVDEVRRLRAFLGSTAGDKNYRVVIVDRADEMNQNAANALLKALEEPPSRTVFLLVAGAEGRLPVTIRSRARTLRLGPLPMQDLEEAVRAALGRDGYDVDEETLSLALALSEGSVRRALALATGDGIGLYRQVVALLQTLPKLDAEQLYRTVDKIAGDSEQLDLFFSILLGLMERLVKFAATGISATDEEAGLGRKLIQPEALGDWAATWEAIGQARADAFTLNLDRSLLLLETAQRLQRLTREQEALS